MRSYTSALLSLVLSVSLLAQNAPMPRVAEPDPEGVTLEQPVEQEPAVAAARAPEQPRVTTHGVYGINQTSPNITATLGTSDSTSSFTVFSSSDLPLLRVRGDGNVGIGTASPMEILDIVRNAAGNTNIRISNSDPGTSGTSSQSGLRFYEGTNPRAYIVSANSGSTNALGGASSLQLWNVANGTMMFGTNNQERMRIFASGGLGVGATTEGQAKLWVLNTTTTVPATTDIIATRSRAGWSGSTGTTAPSTIGALIESGVHSNGGTVTSAVGAKIALIANTGGVITTGYGVYVSDIPATTAWGVYQAAADDANYFAGNVLIGSSTPAPGYTTAKLHVTGDAHFTGTVTGGDIQAKYQDVAEWVPATTDLTPGTVVVLNKQKNNEVMASASAYDTSVAGVVSLRPGLILGEGGPGQEQIATTGRVKVRVDATAAPIRVGDLLVTSNAAGMAMRSEPMALNGRNFHQPGTIIGKALEPLADGVGEILVLLSMQ